MELDLGVCQIRFSSKGGDEVTKKIQKIHEENEKMQTSFKKAKDTFTKTSKGIVAGLTAVGAAAVTACKSTERYREDMAKLNTAYETNKKSAEDAKSTYEDFYGILGESDRTVEAVNHLAFLCDTQEDLSKWGTISAGVMATFGDSLPIEGLTESANETAKVGKVTGVFADALNWAQISEDGFNEALKKCNNEQERSALITNTLYKTYEQAGKQYREMNADIIANRKAQSELNDVMAEIGASVQPILTELTQSTANFLNSNIGTIKGILDGVVGAVQSFFTYVDNNGETIIGVISGIGTAFITWNVSTIIGNLVQGIGAFIGITKTATGVTATFNAVIKSNPAMAAISIVLSLTAAIGTYIGVTKSATSATSEYEKELRNLNEQHQRNMKTIDDSLNTDLAKIKTTETMFDRLLKLDEELKNNSENTAENTTKKAELKMLTEKLNSVCPDFALAIDGETGALINQSGAVQQLAGDYIKLAKAKAYAEAYSEKAKELVKRNIDIDNILDKSEKSNSYASNIDFDENVTKNLQKNTGVFWSYLNEGAKTLYNGLGIIDSETLDNDRNISKLEKEKEQNNAEIEKMFGKAGEQEGIVDSLNDKFSSLKKNTNSYGVSTDGLGSASTGGNNSTNNAQSDYNSWIDSKKENLINQFEYGKINFNDFISQMNKLRDSAYKTYTLEYAEFSKEINAYYDEEVERQRETLDNQFKYGEITFDNYIKGLTAIAEGNYEKSSYEFKTLMSEITELTIADIQSQLESINLVPEYKNRQAKNKYDLWLLTNQNASESEKLSKQAEYLNESIKNDVEKRDNLQKAYDKMVEATGENSEEALMLRDEIEKLNISIQEQTATLEATFKKSTEESLDEKRLFARNVNEFMRYGLSQKEAEIMAGNIKVDASEYRQYDKEKPNVAVYQNIYSPVATPSAVYNAVNKAVKDVEEVLSQ